MIDQREWITQTAHITVGLERWVKWPGSQLCFPPRNNVSQVLGTKHPAEINLHRCHVLSGHFLVKQLVESMFVLRQCVSGCNGGGCGGGGGGGGCS